MDTFTNCQIFYMVTKQLNNLFYSETPTTETLLFILNVNPKQNLQLHMEVFYIHFLGVNPMAQD